MKETLNPRLCEGRILVEPHLGQTSWLRSVSRSARTTVLPSEYTSRVNTALDRQLPQSGLISREVVLRHIEGFAQFAIEVPNIVLCHVKLSPERIFLHVFKRAAQRLSKARGFRIVESVTRDCSSGMFMISIVVCSGACRAVRPENYAARRDEGGREGLSSSRRCFFTNAIIGLPQPMQIVRRDKERTATDESEGELSLVLFDLLPADIALVDGHRK